MTDDGTAAEADVVSLTSEEVTQRAGITYRNLDYWTRKGYIPGVERLCGLGSGIPRRWTEAEAVAVAFLARLVRAGVRVDVAAAALAFEIDRHGCLDDVTEVRLSHEVVVSLRPSVVAAAP